MMSIAGIPAICPGLEEREVVGRFVDNWFGLLRVVMLSPPAPSC